MCGEDFIPASGASKYCGNREKKEGCSYKRLRSWTKENRQTEHSKEYRQEYSENNRDRANGYNKKRRQAGWYKKYEKMYHEREEPKKKFLCRSQTRSLRIQGIIKKENCEVCNSDKAETHHTDYNSPYHIKWLCKKHHVEEHQNIKDK